jgi:hypothetical protein
MLISNPLKKGLKHITKKSCHIFANNFFLIHFSKLFNRFEITHN